MYIYTPKRVNSSGQIQFSLRQSVTKGSVFLIRSGLQLGGEEAMKGIARIVNSLSRLGGREIISRGSSKLASSSSSLHRSLFISAATHFPTNSRDLTSSSRSSSLLPQKWAFLGGLDLLWLFAFVYHCDLKDWDLLLFSLIIAVFFKGLTRLSYLMEQGGREGRCLSKHNPLRILLLSCFILANQSWRLEVLISLTFVQL